MIYPIRYYYRGGVSDRDLILSLMHHIPPSKQQEVSDKYELLYLQDGGINVAKGRKEANEYLEAVSKHFQGERTPDALANHMRKMLDMAKEKQQAPKAKTASGVVNMKPIPKEFKGIQVDW